MYASVYYTYLAMCTGAAMGISSGTENAARSAAALARKFIATCRCKWKAAM